MQRAEHHRVSIPYVEMDVHTANYTLCTTSIEKGKAFALSEDKGTVLLSDILRVVQSPAPQKEHAFFCFGIKTEEHPCRKRHRQRDEKNKEQRRNEREDVVN